jgi:hypothetical protein
MPPNEVIQTPKRTVAKKYLKGEKCKNKKQAQKEAVARNSATMGTRSKLKL